MSVFWNWTGKKISKLFLPFNWHNSSSYCKTIAAGRSSRAWSGEGAARAMLALGGLEGFSALCGRGGNLRVAKGDQAQGVPWSLSQV